MRRFLALALIWGLTAGFCTGAAPVFAQDSANLVQTALVQATDSRLAGDMARTRLVVDLSASVTFHAFVLANPDRVVVDLPQIAFGLKGDAGKHGRGLVSAYRFGLIGPGKSRIVLDLTGPVAIDKAFILDAVDDQPARLVIDLVKADRDAFERAAALAQKPAEAPPASPPDTAASGPGTLPVVVLDPGHGGIDAGASSPSGEQEKNVVFKFAQTLAAKIDATGRYRAVMTRRDDSYITLGDRIQVARDNKAALFISIHADTLPDPFGVRGATIYTLSDKASDAETARYAEKENRADIIAGFDLGAEPDDVADILVDLTRRETKVFSNAFAKILIDDFASAATLNKNAHRSAGFMVLKAPDVPSVLLELGYLSNAQDLKLLTDDGWRDRTTDAVLAAVDGFFALRAHTTAHLGD